LEVNVALCLKSVAALPAKVLFFYGPPCSTKSCRKHGLNMQIKCRCIPNAYPSFHSDICAASVLLSLVELYSVNVIIIIISIYII